MSGPPDGPLSGRVALITGAATGIGRVVAARLGAAGASVVINHPHTPEQAELVVGELRAAGVEAVEAAADVSRRGEFEAAVDMTLTRFGRWDILVANAAVTATRPLVEFTEDAVDTMLSVNIKGAIWGMQLAGAHLADEGRIINMGSSTTALMLPGYTVYDATKAAVEQLTRIGAHELGGRRITVNVVAPGATATETYGAGRGEVLVQKFSAMSPFGRLGTPEEIANVVAFLAGSEAGWITGQVIRVNGGTV